MREKGGVTGSFLTSCSQAKHPCEWLNQDEVVGCAPPLSYHQSSTFRGEIHCTSAAVVMPTQQWGSPTSFSRESPRSDISNGPKSFYTLYHGKNPIGASYRVIGAPGGVREHMARAQQGDSGQRLRGHNRNKHRVSLGANKRAKAVDSHMGFCYRPSGRKRTRSTKWAIPWTEINCVQISRENG